MNKKVANGAEKKIITRHQITILDTNEKYMCSEERHLLQSMSALGKRGIPSGCHGGGCGVCKIKIIEGDVHTIAMSREHISIKEEEEGIVLACRTFPRSEVTLKVIGKLSKNVLRTNAPKKYGFV